MNYVGKLFSGVKGFYNEINSATLTGAIDIIVVEQEDGKLVCSPFHVRFGKMGVIRSREKVVDISINGISVPDVHMKLGEAGEAFFVEELDESVDIPFHLATSPLPSNDELMLQGVHQLREQCRAQRKRSTIERPTSPPLDPEITRRLSDNAVNLVSQSTLMTSSLDTVVQSTSRPGTRLTLSASDFKPIQAGSTVYPLSPKPSRLDILSSHHLDDDSDSAPSDRVKRRHSHRSMKKRKMRAKAKELAKSEERSPESQEGVFDMDMTSPQDDDVTPTVAVSLPIAVENSMTRTDEWASQTQFNSAFHPFSDGDLTPIASPSNSRPQSPKSDTEFERLRQTNAHISMETEEVDVRWPWGELPDAGVIAKVKSSAVGGQEDSKTIKAGEKKDLMKFLKSNQKRFAPRKDEGMYLDQLNKEDLDPELAALYLYQARSSSHQLRHKDEDCESGRGASLPMSPVSTEGAKSSDESDEKNAHIEETNDNWGDISMSLCGALLDDSGKISQELFMQSLITYDDFVQCPELINNHDLVIRVGSKFYNWQVAGPFILSLCVYQRPLPGVAMENLVKSFMPKKATKQRGGYSSWFSWRRAPQDDITVTMETEKQKLLLSGQALVAMENEKGQALVAMETEKQKLLLSGQALVAMETEQSKTLAGEVSTMSSPGSTPPRTPAVRSPSKNDETSSEAETESSDKDSQLKYLTHLREKYKKVVRLTSDQLESLNLHEGRNEVTFSVTTALQGTTRCTSHIYKWKYNDRVVISDIDGTITKSDVLGQILPMMGKDWSQTGVAQLYSKIAMNGYKFLYLSARAIGQSTTTRDYLRSIRQGELMLPDGPLLLSPSSLISAFHREVIERKPEEFKISCLRDIGALFPEESNPFYAGFGNKINDVWAYRATGIPISRIFTINHRGELRHELTHTFQSTYTSLSDVSDHFFPSLNSQSRVGTFHAPDKFSTFTYWRDSLPEIDDEIKLFFGDLKG